MDCYELIINDIRLNDREEIKNMEQWIRQKKVPYTFASERIQNNEVYSLVVGVGNYGITSKPLTLIHLMRYLYRKMISLLRKSKSVFFKNNHESEDKKGGKLKTFYLLNPLYMSGTDNKLLKVVRRKKRISPESILGKRRVLFPRGMDVSENYPGDYRSRDFHYFFCHGNHDQQIVERNTRKPVEIIGYPRYDHLIECDDQSNAILAAEFGIDYQKIGKPIVLWLTSSIGWLSDRDANTKLWMNVMLSLTDQYEVIYRPHPTRARNNPELMSKLESRGLKMDYKSERDMTGMYALSDFVICDYGGTIFSALYCDKPILLLNHPDQPTIDENSELDLKIRNSLDSLDYDEHGDNVANLIRTLNDGQLWDGQKIKRRILRRVFFSGAPIGEGAKKAANKLQSLLHHHLK